MHALFESPLEPFESPKELLNGTKERLTELEALCQSVSETRDYEFITHIDPKTREKVIKLRLKRKFPPRIRTLASSIMKEMRIALDQAFCEAAVALGRRDAKGIYFPFGKDPEDLKEVVKRNCVGVDRRLINYCLGFKPYYGGDSDGILWSMSRLAGTTHQKIIGAGFQDTTSFGEAVVKAVGPLQLIINKWDSLHNELEVARLTPQSELRIKKDFTLRLNIIFSGSAHALSYRPLVQSLYNLLGIVMSIVFDIEAETARLLREDSASNVI
jgi:hypothetical protein